ncbi:hypothetical protein D3C73_1370720 [compost metagenome]
MNQGGIEYLVFPQHLENVVHGIFGLLHVLELEDTIVDHDHRLEGYPFAEAADMDACHGYQLL